MPSDTNKKLYPVRRDGNSRLVRTADDGNLFRHALSGALKGLFASVAAGMILLTALCLIAFSDPEPETLVLPLGLLSLTCASLIGGAVAALTTPECPILCSSLTGTALTVVMILVGALFFGKSSLGLGIFIELALRAAVVLFPILGALFVSKLREVEKNSRQRRRIRRHR